MLFPVPPFSSDGGRKEDNFTVYLVEVARALRRNRTDVAADGRNREYLSCCWCRLRRARSWWPTSSAAASAFHWIRGAEGSCASSANSSSDTGGGRTRKRTACRIVRVCLESVAWVSSSKRRFFDSRDILAARWCRHWWAAAFAAVSAEMRTLPRQHSVVLLGELGIPLVLLLREPQRVLSVCIALFFFSCGWAPPARPIVDEVVKMTISPLMYLRRA